VCASLEYFQDQWRSGQTCRCGIWAINDRWTPVPDAAIYWRILDAAGQEQISGKWDVSMPEDSVQKLGTAEWTAAASGSYQLRAEVRDQSGHRLSQNMFDFVIVQ